MTWSRPERLPRRWPIGLLAAALLLPCAKAPAQSLTADEVRRVVSQAAAQAQRDGLRAHVAVVDAEGNLLAIFSMDGAPAQSVIPGTPGQGLEGTALPATLAAQAKAASGAFLSSGGNAFSTRTASFIVQEHFPPGTQDTPGGPLFGVQFSSLVCTDVRQPNGVLGLSADPGGLPLYRNGRVVGGVGVEGDGRYALDLDPSDRDQPAEERAATAGQAGFAPPDLIRAENILADGIAIPYNNSTAEAGGAAVAGRYVVEPRGGLPSAFVSGELGGLAVRLDPRFPVRAGSALSAEEVRGILSNAVKQAARTRGAIRQPLGMTTPADSPTSASSAARATRRRAPTRSSRRSRSRRGATSGPAPSASRSATSPAATPSSTSTRGPAPSCGTPAPRPRCCRRPAGSSPICGAARSATTPGASATTPG